MMPAAGGLEHAEALPHVVENVARVGVGLDRELGPGEAPASASLPASAVRAGSASRKTRRPMPCQMLPRNLTRPAWGACRREPRHEVDRSYY